VQSIPQVEAAQTTVPWHEFGPVQLAVTVVPYILTTPAQDPFPEQVNVHESPEQVTSEVQAPSPLQVI
jgi:hypothetical protein